MATIGLTNLHYAIMTTEDTASSAPVYGTPKRLTGINSVSISHDTETAKLYGDNQTLDTRIKNKSSTITLEIADLKDEDRAAILGLVYNSSTGVTSVTSTGTAPNVAIMYEENTLHNKKRLRVFYKGKFAPTQEDTNTEGETMEYGLDNLEGEFVYRIDNNKKEDMRTIDATDTVTAAAFFASVGGGLT